MAPILFTFFESPFLKYYTTDGYTKVLTDFFEDHKPNILLIGATNNGRDLAPRMSGRMQNGVVADCTILTVDTEEGLVEWTRPALGGNILAEIISPNHRPQMGSVRPNVFKSQTASRTVGAVFNLNNLTSSPKTFAPND